MCSIFSILDLSSDITALRATALDMSRRLRHRGPDWSGIYCSPHAILAHERLAIVDPDSGAQPLSSTDEQQILAVNGEIYNHQALRDEYAQDYAFKTHSDCEIILPLYQKQGTQFLDQLNGIFAFVLFDEVRKTYLIARDHMGIIPLYMGYDKENRLYIASELKALVPVCTHIEEFPPGHYLDANATQPQRYYQRTWMQRSYTSTPQKALRTGLEQAVKRQLMSDVPYGVLLSGGLDSSVIAAITKKFAERRIEDNSQSPAWWPQLHSFSIGLKDAPDLIAARTVAKALNTVHHEIHFTVQEGLDALKDVIYHLETFDVTTVRASTPMYLLARKIKAMGVKMVLSGEGADELFGGYLYFHKAPNAKEFHEETVRKLSKLHQFDCLRANKAMAAWGVEARVPFLDKEFIDLAMMLDPEEKMCRNGKLEKHVLRAQCTDLLPESILWRQKEQFSDGVGYTWIDGLKDAAEAQISDAQFAAADKTFAINPPQTKEAYFYRALFEAHFAHTSVASLVPAGPSIACSTPIAIAWDESFAKQADPSGRAINIHQKH